MPKFNFKNNSFKNGMLESLEKHLDLKSSKNIIFDIETGMHPNLINIKELLLITKSILNNLKYKGSIHTFIVNYNPDINKDESYIDITFTKQERNFDELVEEVEEENIIVKEMAEEMQKEDKSDDYVSLVIPKVYLDAHVSYELKNKYNDLKATLSLLKNAYSDSLDNLELVHEKIEEIENKLEDF